MAKKQITIDRIKPMNVLLYDDNNIIYYDGTLTSIDMEQQINEYNLNGKISKEIAGSIITLNVSNFSQLDNIKLDDTTMKRIAVFNKQSECKRLDKIIEEKKKVIKELDDNLQDKEKRWKKVKEYIANIYELDLNDDYDDYEELDY